MKNTITWIIIVLIVVVAVLWLINRPAVVDEPVVPGEESLVLPQSVVVALSVQNDSGVSGLATLTGLDGSTLVVLSLSGAPEGIAQPAHIHAGSCAEIGAVVYPLTFPVDGVSETTLNVSLDTILGQLPLALNVHKSPEEADIYVACGDLAQ
jgi:hypothetical protein